MPNVSFAVSFTQSVKSMAKDIYSTLVMGQNALKIPVLQCFTKQVDFTSFVKQQRKQNP